MSFHSPPKVVIWPMSCRKCHGGVFPYNKNSSSVAASSETSVIVVAICTRNGDRCFRSMVATTASERKCRYERQRCFMLQIFISIFIIQEQNKKQSWQDRRCDKGKQRGHSWNHDDHFDPAVMLAVLIVVTHQIAQCGGDMVVVGFPREQSRQESRDWDVQAKKNIPMLRRKPDLKMPYWIRSFLLAKNPREGQSARVASISRSF